MATVTTLSSNTRPQRYGLPIWMDRVVTEVHRLSTSPDAEAVHDARVAIRRCRSLAAVLQEVDPHPAWAEMKKLPRKLFRSLGKLRDAQVLQAWVKRLVPENDPLRAQLLKILEEREAESRQRALRAAEKFDEKTWRHLARTLQRRARLVPLNSLAAQCLALERYEEARELHTRALRSTKPKPWHALRIGLKRFRYTVENLLPERHAAWEEGLKRVQDLLGELNDLTMLTSLLKEESGRAAADSAEFLRRAIEQERKALVENYRQRTLGRASLWQEWRAGLPRGARLEAAAAARLRATARALDAHPRRTAEISRLAIGLFDALAHSRRAPRFRERETRRILLTAARLHGLGAGDKRKSPQKAAHAILRDLPRPPGWKPEDWQTLIWTVRYHRGAEPKPKHRGFARLPEEQRNLVRGLAGVLRLARALRRCGAEAEKGIRVEETADATILRLPGLTLSEENAARLAKGKYLLEVYLRRPLLIEPAEKVVTLPTAHAAQETHISEVSAASD